MENTAHRTVHRRIRGYATSAKAYALRVLLQVGMCYRTDFIKFMAFGQNGNVSSAVRVLKSLEKDGDIISYEALTDNGHDKTNTYTIIKLTKYGRLQAVEMSEGTEYHKYLKEHKDTFENDTHKSDPVYIRRWCHDARVKMMFESAGAVSLPCEKPSLKHLYEAVSNHSSSSGQEAVQNSNYADDMTADECRELLQSGIYYSILELRDFLTSFSKKDADVIYSSRARGIFISDKSMFVVYVTRRGCQRMIAFRGNELRILEAIRPLAALTHVEREVPSMDRHSISSSGQMFVSEKFFHHVYALLISDNDSIVYAMTMNRAHGRIKDTDSGRQKNFNYNPSLLDADSELYDRIFVTPYTLSGMDSLSYLCSTTIEEYQSYVQGLLGKNRNFIRDTSDPLYMFDEASTPPTPAIYFPVYEVKELAAIASSKNSTAVITYHDMFEAIAHSVRKEIHYFDAEDLSRIPGAFIGVYDSDGRLKGYNILLEALKQQGYKNAHNELVSLPKKFGMSTAEFFNGVVDGSVSVDDALSRINGGKLQSNIQASGIAKAKTKSTSITMKVPDDVMSDIRKAAKLKGISPTRYARDLLLSCADQIKSDADAHTANLRKVRAVWNQ